MRTLCLGLLAGFVYLPHAEALDFPAVENAASIYQHSDVHLQLMFKNGLLDTSRQSYLDIDGTAYVKTGDIPAEWFRDASAQVKPYIYFAKSDPLVTQFLRGMIQRIGKNLKLDPYANAFKLDYAVWEQKFELDSLAYPIILAFTYWQHTGDSSIFTAELEAGLDRALAVMESEQNHSANSTYKHWELPNKGVGNPSGQTGMIWSGFRPSDDPCKYNYLIPSEMMAVVALGDLERIEREIYHSEPKALRAGKLRAEVHAGIQNYGIVTHPKYGKIYAYEVDGLGNSNLMDDGNIPSLLSSPYVGYFGALGAKDPVYQSTRSFVLSNDNPYFYTGNFAKGVGSPHTPPGFIWPLAILAQGLTATSSAEKDLMLKELLDSDPGDGLLHESFFPDNPKRYTRRDFGWPNSLFAEYVMTTYQGFAPLPVGSTEDLTFAK